MRNPESNGRRKRRTALIVAILVCAPLLWGFGLWREGLRARHSDYYYSVTSQLFHIYLGLQLYEHRDGHLPPATAPDPATGHPVSWRIEVFEETLQDLRVGDVFYDREQVWHHSSNLRLQDNSAYYLLFSYSPTTSSGRFATHYKAITGTGTAFDPERRRSLRDLPGDLVLVVWVANSETHWMEPGDLPIEELLTCEDPCECLIGPLGCGVLFADGARWMLSPRLPFVELRKFFTIEDAAQNDRDKVLAPYRIRPRI
jgi:hypothetical protein